MEKIKNHYIPQFIIRRFSETTNVFNKETGIVSADKKPKKIFYREGQYKPEVEDALNKKMEVLFAALLKNKLLNEEEITINRAELFLIKKFMFITSIRAQSPEFIRKLLLSLEDNTERYLNILRTIYDDIGELEKTKESTLSDFDLYNNILMALCDYNYDLNSSTYDLFKDKRLTVEMAALATLFFSSYVAFWDAPDDGEYLLSDAGMVTEYEGFHLLSGGFDISKLSYIVHQINHDKQNGYLYAVELANNAIMYENYNIFNISSTRCIVAINPFFRLYAQPEITVGGRKVILPVPDIWPSVIQNKDLFKMPTSNRILPFAFLPDDTFTYKPKKLTEKELLYINSLLYTQSQKNIGFNDPEKVYPSFNFILNSESHYLSVKTKEDTDEQVISGYFNNLFTHKLNDLLDWCEEKGCRLTFDPEPVFEEVIENIYKDFRTNYYIYEYMLDRYEITYNESKLDFLGKGNKQKKMEYITNQYNLLKSQRKS